MQNRNIVLITLDSLRADHCSFMGYRRETTPTLDRMARDGLYFTNAISSTCGCTPGSMVGVFTGEYSYFTQGVNPRPWRDELYRRKTLAEYLSEKGYSTGAFVSNAFVSHYFGFDKGFDYFQDFLSDSKKTLTKLLNRNLMNLISKKLVFKHWESYYDIICEWVEKVNKPFFLWVLLVDTHYPYLIPRKYRKWCNLFDMFYYNWKVRSNNWCPTFNEVQKQKIINCYDDSIRYADAFIERLWKDIKDEDPIFIIHADHGEGFGEHGFYMHNPPLLYEELIHVPLVIYNADVKGCIDKPVSLLGLSPTILKLIGEERSSFPSKSFLHDSRSWVISMATLEDGKVHIAVRMKDWKFIRGQKEEDELYYLKKDPYEQRNVIDEYPELAKEMRRIAEIHAKQVTEKRRIREGISKIKL
mgnify:CR=1 FL=1